MPLPRTGLAQALASAGLPDTCRIHTPASPRTAGSPFSDPVVSTGSARACRTSDVGSAGSRTGAQADRDSTQSAAIYLAPDTAAVATGTRIEVTHRNGIALASSEWYIAVGASEYQRTHVRVPVQRAI
jgi:hypothetical protein